AKALPPDELERWLVQTVLPRKAPWIAQANAEIVEASMLISTDVLRPLGGKLR
ncbi:MAG: hypothetical protein H7322_18505, partial [Ramlibacter sp.]|nr:hypothetical protein [Ramlibacter sp.]